MQHQHLEPTEKRVGDSTFAVKAGAQSRLNDVLMKALDQGATLRNAPASLEKHHGSSQNPFRRRLIDAAANARRTLRSPGARTCFSP
jgi:hypothetical protein